MSDSRSSRFAVSMDDLERSVHVPHDELLSAQPEPPAAGPMPAEELDRQRLLGITGAGRLRL